jgi:hypothetical protein
MWLHIFKAFSSNLMCYLSDVLRGLQCVRMLRCGGNKTKLEKIGEYARSGCRECKIGIKIGNREFANFANEEFASVEGLLQYKKLRHNQIAFGWMKYLLTEHSLYNV